MYICLNHVYVNDNCTNPCAVIQPGTAMCTTFCTSLTPIRHTFGYGYQATYVAVKLPSLSLFL